MLIRAHRQEALSRAYIHAVAGRCGLLCSTRDYDYGIDTTLHSIDRGPDERYYETGFNLDIQAKSTTLAAETPTAIGYDLEVRAYDHLRDANAGTPRILVLLVVPADEPAWVEQTEDHLLLRKCAYWLSLRGMGPTTNTRTLRVSIPRGQVFSAEALSNLMGRIRKGEPL